VVSYWGAVNEQSAAKGFESAGAPLESVAKGFESAGAPLESVAKGFESAGDHIGSPLQQRVS